jgi:hypothetical protein
MIHAGSLPQQLGNHVWRAIKLWCWRLERRRPITGRFYDHDGEETMIGATFTHRNSAGGVENTPTRRAL